MKYSIGDKMPEFELPDENGALFHSSTMIGKPYVLFFYPKDESLVCTKQACMFRDMYQDFINNGIEVIGVSQDTSASHKQFIQRNTLPYRLLSDHDARLKNLLGIQDDFWGIIRARITICIDEQGHIVHIFRSQLLAQRHVVEALQALLSVAVKKSPAISI